MHSSRRFAAPRNRPNATTGASFAAPSGVEISALRPPPRPSSHRSADSMIAAMADGETGRPSHSARRTPTATARAATRVRRHGNQAPVRNTGTSFTSDR